MRRVIIAYSGGVDTALAIHWLRTERQFDVIAFLANVGQGLEMPPAARSPSRWGPVPSTSRIYAMCS